MADWLKQGLIHEAFDIATGFEAVPDAALAQFTGGNMGRKLVQIADDSIR